MKKLLLLAIMAVMTTAGFAQDKIILPIDSSTNMVTYDSVVVVENTSASELYLRALSWYAYTFKSSEDVIQFKDKETGKIIGKGSMKMAMPSALGTPISGYTTFTCTIIVKDGKFKYVFTDFVWHYPQGSVNMEKIAKKSGQQSAKREFHELVSSLTTGLIDSMRKPTVSSDF